MRFLHVLLVMAILSVALGCRSAVQQTDIVSGGGLGNDSGGGSGTPVLWQGADEDTVSGMWFGQRNAEGALLIVTTEKTIVAIPEALLVKLPGQGGGSVNIINTQTVAQGKSFPMSILNPRRTRLCRRTPKLRKR